MDNHTTRGAARAADLDGGITDRYSGSSVSAAGDVNGDGLDDLIVGAPESSLSGDYTGASYVVFGSDAGFAASLDLAALDGSDGFRLAGASGDRSGWSVSAAGDFNDDGTDDVIVGAPSTDSTGGADAGAGYVIFGTTAGFSATLNLATLDGNGGLRIDGVAAGNWSGASVSAAGDVNGDGFDDLIIGAPRADPGGREDAGESYIVFGFDTDELLTPIFGGLCHDVLTGSDDSESFHPGGGRDFVTTSGGKDTIFFDDRAGKRDVQKVADFDLLSDTLDLRDTAVGQTFSCATKTILLLDGPYCDRVVLLGLSESPLDLI